MMNNKQPGRRMAFKYALSIIISGVFFINCFNNSEIEEPMDAPTLNESGAKLSQKDSTKENKQPEKVQDNLRIVLRTVVDVNSEDEDDHHEHEVYRYGSHHEDHDFDELNIDRIYLSFGRIEVLSPSKGWTVVQSEPAQARTLEIPYQPDTEAEIMQTVVEAGEYTHIKVYMTNDNYLVFSTDPGTFHPLFFEHDDHHKKHSEHLHDGENEVDTPDGKGHRFKVKHFKPVVVQEGYLTTIYLEVELDELVEYEDDINQYVIEPEANYIESLLSPLTSGEKEQVVKGK